MLKEVRGAKTGLLGQEMLTGDLRGNERNKRNEERGDDVERCTDWQKLLQ